MREESHAEQVTDDFELLELMMADKTSVPELYNPPDYWRDYEKKFLPELRSLGLTDFRRRKNSVLFTFGASDLLPKSWRTDSLILKFIKSSLRLRRAEKLWTIISKFITGIDIKNLRLLYFELAKLYGEKNGAKPINDLQDSLVGNPEDVFSVSGKHYTPSFLSYYCQYAYCSKYVDFNSIDTVMEIGSGAGRQIEVTKKLHPDLCFYVFDVPPQLYVCEQYLSALFPESVVSYRETRTLKRMPEKKKGRIYIFGNWKIADLENLNYDLFWNSASFQELESAVALNYLKYVNKQTNRHVFLCELMKGSEHEVYDKTTLEHYKRGLKDFQLRDISKAVLSLYTSREPYYYSFWNKQT